VPPRALLGVGVSVTVDVGVARVTGTVGVEVGLVRIGLAHAVVGAVRDPVGVTVHARRGVYDAATVGREGLPVLRPHRHELVVAGRHRHVERDVVRPVAGLDGCAGHGLTVHVDGHWSFAFLVLRQVKLLRPGLVA